MKPKTCANRDCRKKFLPRYNALQRTCCKKCAIVVGKKQVAEQEAKGWRERKKKIKEQIEKRSVLEGRLQEEVNLIARLLDDFRPCISCGTLSPGGFWQGGHYHSTAAQSTIRFHLWNIHKQCYRCNVELSANQTGYIEGVEKRYGKARAEYLATTIIAENKGIKLTREDLSTITRAARLIVARLRGGEKLTRDGINAALGIYRG